MLENFSQSLTKEFWLLSLSILLSANIAFFAYSHWNWSEGVWSVVTIAAVANADFNHTITKMWARLAGTLAGAAYAFFVIHYFAGHLVLLCVLLSLGVYVFSLLAFQKSAWNYGGLIANVTMFIVLGTAVHDSYGLSAVDRIYQVIFGIIVLAVVNTFIHYYFISKQHHHRIFATRLLSLLQESKTFILNHSISWTAFKVVFAMLLTLIPWLVFRYPGGFWAPISCFFILEESVDRINQKSKYRFISHLLAASFGLIAVLAFHNHQDLLFIPLSLGFLVCIYILTLKRTYNTMGNTMGIAIAIMLLADPNSTTETIVARFLNVMLGIAVGLFIARFIHRIER